MKRKFKTVLAQYMSEGNPRWLHLTPRSREIYLSALPNLARFNDLWVDEIDRPMVIQLRDDLYDKPGKCRIALTVLSNILGYAMDKGYTQFNPAFRIAHQPPSTPIKRWSDGDIQQFLSTAPDRLVYAVQLAFYTGQRRSDLVRMTWPDYDGELIHVVQKKTKRELYIPVHPRLKTMLDAMPRDNLTILNKLDGDRWSAEGLSEAVKDHCLRIGMDDKSIHGLRKSTASVLAEMGCDPFQIAAITGQSLKEVMRYTAEVQQKKLAREAMAKWK